ncbi:hypothetical protein GRF29_19g3191321, partial [Pseudopithomyces chartarum]
MLKTRTFSPISPPNLPSYLTIPPQPQPTFPRTPNHIPDPPTHPPHLTARPHPQGLEPGYANPETTPTPPTPAHPPTYLHSPIPAPQPNPTITCTLALAAHALKQLPNICAG